MFQLIGISGYAQSGKDTTGQILVRDCGFERYAFADLLKKALYALNPAVGVNQRTGKVTFLKPYMDGLSGSWEEKWDQAKVLPEVRRLLQRMGTEVGRQTFSDNFWVEWLFRKVEENKSGRVAITDVRFPNEAQAIKDRGGVVVRIHRPGVGPLKDAKGRVHLSEVALDDWKFDYHIHNDGSPTKLAEKISKIINQVEGE